MKRASDKHGDLGKEAPRCLKALQASDIRELGLTASPRTRNPQDSVTVLRTQSLDSFRGNPPLKNKKMLETVPLRSKCLVRGLATGQRGRRFEAQALRARRTYTPSPPGPLPVGEHPLSKQKSLKPILNEVRDRDQSPTPQTARQLVIAPGPLRCRVSCDCDSGRR